MTTEINKGDTKMANTTIFKTLIDWYNEKSYTHSYIFGFSYKGNVYMTHSTSETLPYVLKLDKASRGAGYSLRFKPNMAQKLLLLTNSEVLCSVEFFKSTLANSKYNKGEVFERLVTEYYGQEWKKDTVPFWVQGDINLNGEEVQIKLDSATLMNTKQVAKLKG
jgi:hypothetical protein